MILSILFNYPKQGIPIYAHSPFYNRVAVKHVFENISPSIRSEQAWRRMSLAAQMGRLKDVAH